jgi:diguanylate cyclase (GGDEF)-like protein/PAS domain S-box-containing protein
MTAHPRKHFVCIIRPRLAPWLISGLVLLGGLCVTAVLWRDVQQNDTDNLRASFESSADMVVKNIRGRFNGYAMVMRGVKGFFEASEHITADEFRTYVQNLHLDQKAGVQGIGLVKIVAGAEKVRHIREMQKDGVPDYQIKPGGQRQRYAPIMHMEPLTGGNLKALGLDILSVPTAHAAAEKSRDINDIAITSRLSLIQDTGKPGVFGFVMYLPIYHSNVKLDTLADRRAAIAGWVDVPFRMNDLMAGLRGELDPNIDFEIHDAEPLSGQNRLYDSDDTSFQARLEQGMLQTSRQLDIGGRRWTLLMNTTPAFVTRVSNQHRPLIVASAGIALTLTLSWLAWLLVKRRETAQLQYRKLFDQAGEGVLVLTCDHRFIDANHSALQLLGYTYDELLQLRLPDIMGKHELPRHDPGINKIMAGTPHLEELMLVRKDGTEFMTEINTRRLDSESYFAIFRDLTERKKAEQRIQRLAKLYQALSETNQAIVRMDNETDLLPLVCRCAVNFGGMKMAWIGQLDEARGLIEPVAAYGTGLQYLNGLSISSSGAVPEGGPTGTALRENRPVIINNYLANPMTRSWHARTKQFGWGSAATFPIQRNGMPFAVLTVYHAQTDAFDEEATRLLDEMVVDISFGLDNIDRETQRQITEKALAESEARMSVILENVGAYIYLKDSDGRYLFANRRVLELWNTTMEEVIGFGDEKFFDAQSVAQIRENDRSVLLDGKTIEREETNSRTATGKTATYWTVKLPLRRENGSIYGLCGISTDITTLKKLELSLYEKEQLLSESQRIAHIGSWRVDIASQNFTWSEETYRIYQVGPDNFEHTFDSFMQLIHPEDRQAMQTWVNSCLTGKEPSPLQFRTLLPDASIRILEGQGVLEYDASHKPVAINGTVQDITERSLAEQQLRLNAQVFESSREGILITDASNTIVSINRAYTDISGYAPEEVIGKPPRLTLGKQGETFDEEMWRTILSRGHWQGEVINRRKNGELYPQRLSINVIRDPKGRITNHISILSDITDYKAAEERIQFLSNFDSLTHLPNHVLLRDRSQLALAAARRAHEKIVLMYLDIDRFNIVNDSLGTSAGDQLLIEFSNRLSKHLHPDDTLSRQGSDEFNLLLLNTDTEEAAHIAQEILKLIAQPFTIESQRLTLTASIGIAEFPQDGDNFEQLAQSADAALFRAKQNGRNNFQFFTTQLHERAKEVLQIENELRHGLEQGELLLHYQPQVNAKTFKIIGVEALVRWLHPQKGLVLPGRFIPIAEESDLIIDIGNWVLQTAIQQVADWQTSGLPIVPVAINLSAGQFRQDTFYQSVVQALCESKLDPAMLELELTENIAMENSERTTSLLDKLHALGVGLSIDDFGTGYSSLCYLKRFRINKLKIDQSFIRDLGRDPEDEAIVTAIIDMSRSLKFKTIAEGVETREQLDFLREKQCDEIQGFFFSKPVPAEIFAELLHNGGMLGISL